MFPGIDHPAEGLRNGGFGGGLGQGEDAVFCYFLINLFMEFIFDKKQDDCFFFSADINSKPLAGSIGQGGD